MNRFQRRFLGIAFLAFAIAGPILSARGDEPDSAERQEMRRQLKRQLEDAVQLWQQNKRDEAIAAMEEAYKLEKRLSGEADKNLDRPLDILLKMYERKEDFAGLRSAHK